MLSSRNSSRARLKERILAKDGRTGGESQRRRDVSDRGGRLNVLGRAHESPVHGVEEKDEPLSSVILKGDVVEGSISDGRSLSSRETSRERRKRREGKRRERRRRARLVSS